MFSAHIFDYYARDDKVLIFYYKSTELSKEPRFKKMKEGLLNRISILTNRAQYICDWFFDFLFPAECLGCGRYGEWVCSECLKKIDLWPEDLCINCGSKKGKYALCPDCKKSFSLEGILIAGNYDNRLLAKMIKNFKYRFNRGLAKSLTHFLAHGWRNRINKNFFTKNQEPFLNIASALLIPVPLHRKRQNWRGFNQSEELCKKLAGILGLEYECGGLKRIKYKKPQARLTAKERKRNIIGCFAWQGGLELSSKTIILVDDVATTGATLDECAKVLKGKGAKEVWGFVVAKG